MDINHPFGAGYQKRLWEAQQHAAQMHQQQPPWYHELEIRLIEMEDFLKYAADVDPNFEKLLAGWRARKRIGLGK